MLVVLLVLLVLVVLTLIVVDFSVPCTRSKIFVSIINNVMHTKFKGKVTPGSTSQVIKYTMKLFNELIGMAKYQVNKNDDFIEGRRAHIG